MKRLRSALIFCAAVFACAAHAAEDASEATLLQRLHQPVVLRGEFVQSRQIAGFRRPVESSGEFVVARGQGLLWHTRKPFESLLSVNRERLRVTDGKDGVETTLDARREPMLRTLNDLLQSVVIADVAVLKARFDLAIDSISAGGWELALQPRDAALRSRFREIHLAGDAYVQSVRLVEANGDVTTVRFERQQEAARLTDAEAGDLR